MSKYLILRKLLGDWDVSWFGDDKGVKQFEFVDELDELDNDIITSHNNLNQQVMRDRYGINKIGKLKNEEMGVAWVYYLYIKI